MGKIKKAVKALNQSNMGKGAKGPTLNGHQSQASLYLKANYEYLRGNAKRALKLVSDARAVSQGGDASEEGQSMNDGAECDDQWASRCEEAVFYNNMGVLHHSIDKHHAALLYFEKALSIVSNPDSKNFEYFWGSSQLLKLFPVCEVLHNSSICALSLKQHVSSYQCMANCIKRSPTNYAKRPRCWFHMGEALLGVWTDLKYTVTPNADASGRSITSNQFGAWWYVYGGSGKAMDLPVEPTTHDELGGEVDVAEICVDPLSRALFCFERAIELEGQRDIFGSVGGGSYLASCLSIAFCYLELQSWNLAVKYSRMVLEGVAEGKEGGAPHHNAADKAAEASGSSSLNSAVAAAIAAAADEKDRTASELEQEAEEDDDDDDYEGMGGGDGEVDNGTALLVSEQRAIMGHEQLATLARLYSVEATCMLGQCLEATSLIKEEDNYTAEGTITCSAVAAMNGDFSAAELLARKSLELDSQSILAKNNLNFALKNLG